MTVLETHNLTKRYGRITAVDDLSLKVQEGMTVGILGPNGSGKSTTLGIVLNIIKADRGSYTWFEEKFGKEERMHIGSLLETPNFYPYLSAYKNLEIIAHIKRVSTTDILKLLELVNLSNRKNDPFSTFSYGMKQRLAIAAALIGDPPVLILDEPTNGLDPQGIAEVRNLIRDISIQGKTIIMASHILDEVEKVCSHVAIMHKGKLLSFGKVGEIINKNRIIEIGAEDISKLKETLAAIPEIRKVEQSNNILLLEAYDNLTASELGKMLAKSDIIPTHLVVRTRSLESEFLEITADKKTK